MLLRPLVLIPLYWLLLARARRGPVSGRVTLVFLLLSTVFVYGLGMHLAANAIGHVIHDGSSDAYVVSHFFDEVAAHILWHTGVMGLSVLLVWAELRNGGGAITARWPLILAGAIYGLTFFLMVIEGATVAIGLPFAVIFSLALLARRAVLGRLSTLFAVGYVVASVLLVGWGVYWRGFPEPSDLGII